MTNLTILEWLEEIATLGVIPYWTFVDPNETFFIYTNTYVYTLD